MSRSPIAQDFAEEIAPSLVRELQERKAELLQLVNPVARFAFRTCWGSVLRLVPMLVESAISALLTKFGGMSFNDLAAKLDQHKKAVEGDTTAHRIPIHEL